MPSLTAGSHFNITTCSLFQHHANQQPLQHADLSSLVMHCTTAMHFAVRSCKALGGAAEVAAARCCGAWKGPCL